MEAIIAQIGVYSAIALAAIELAKRIAEVVPGKKDDEVVGMVMISMSVVTMMVMMVVVIRFPTAEMIPGW